MSYEYKVIPAPTRGLKAKGIKTAPDRFANALQTEMNAQAGDGWEYLRTDTLPSEQREGLLSKTTVYQNMLVFRRAKASARPAFQPTEPRVAPLPQKSGEERLAEKERLTQPNPTMIKKPIAEKKADPSPDVTPQ